MVHYHIVGGKKLSGSIATGSGKNSPIALICASLLMKGVVRLGGITPVEEINRILEVLVSIGVRVSWEKQDTLVIDTTGKITPEKMDKTVAAKVRIALLLFGALAAKFPTFKVYRTGGCDLGERTIQPHTRALAKLGISIGHKSEYYDVHVKTLRGAHVTMYESSDTATENVIMAAVLAKGITKITFASANYMVQDLCYFLNECGANIRGIGTTTLIIEGVQVLNPPAVYHPIPDPVDAMAWISLAVTTASPLTITQCPVDFLELELEYLSMMGQKIVRSKTYISKNGHFELMDVTLPVSKLHANHDKLHPRPYPGLNIDAIPLFMPILTRAKGRTLVHDWIYENRALYALDLQKLGAKVTLLDPHRVWIEGQTQLRGGELVCPPALRPGMALLIAMLSAKGESTLRNAYMIERGYGDVAKRLKALGADIRRVTQS